MPKRELPADPLRFIRECVQNRRVLWTYHVSMRLKGRFIPREAILGAVESYTAIGEFLRGAQRFYQELLSLYSLEFGILNLELRLCRAVR
jgi:hypothetical protein